MSKSDDMQHINFLKGCVITPSEVKWFSERSDAHSVMILARARAESAPDWLPLVWTEEIDLEAEATRINDMKTECINAVMDCNQLLMPKKQRGIVEGEEFVSHGKNQIKLEGWYKCV